ncbi:hypothetical protein D3C81_2091220 [compost metagenome]
MASLIEPHLWRGDQHGRGLLEQVDQQIRVAQFPAVAVQVQTRQGLFQLTEPSLNGVLQLTQHHNPRSVARLNIRG